MTSSLNKSRSEGYAACIRHITDDGYRSAQERAKDLGAKHHKTADERAYLVGFSEALQDTAALDVAPYSNLDNPRNGS